MEVPRTPPIIVAMKAIPDDVDAEELVEWSNDVIEGLIKGGIKVFSYACDGTAVERKVQTLLMAKHQGTKATYPIIHPVNGFVDVEIIYVYGQPVVMIQDSKHALKMYRNNLTSGARLLVLGNFVTMFRMLIEMEARGCPIYHRDVHRLDR